MSRIPLNPFCVVCASRRIKLLRIWRALPDFGVPSAFQHPNVPQTKARRDRIQNARCWGFPSRWIPASSCMSGTAWQSSTRVAARSCRAKKKGQKKKAEDARARGMRRRQRSRFDTGTQLRPFARNDANLERLRLPVVVGRGSSSNSAPQRSQTLDVRCRLLPLLALTRIRLASSPPPRGAGERKKKKKKKKKRNSRQKRPWRNALVGTSHCHRLPEAPPSFRRSLRLCVARPRLAVFVGLLTREGFWPPRFEAVGGRRTAGATRASATRCFSSLARTWLARCRDGTSLSQTLPQPLLWALQRIE